MKRLLWQALLTSDLNFRYWTKIVRRSYNADKYCKIVLAFTSSTTVAGWTIWAEVFPLWQILSAISAAIALCLPYWRFGDTIEESSRLRSAWLELMNDYEVLWERRERFTDDELLQRIQAARKKEKRVVEKPFLPYDEGLIKKCQDEVLRARKLKRNNKKGEKKS